MSETECVLHPIGVVRSPLRNRKDAPKQGDEGAPDAWLVISSEVADGLHGIKAGDEIIVITWLHQGHHDVLKVHPRKDLSKPLMGVFATRSPDRPNPLGLHQVTVRSREQDRMLVGPIEVIDGTPIVDIKPILCRP
jgi:tRNA-Thr(GGU) m(6)t(6)A37 methyltransferase TsaA